MLSLCLIYGHRFGFPGGVSWSILVARECVTNPLASPSTLVRQALTTLVQWPWSDQQLQLSSPEGVTPPELHQEHSSVMNILTPGLPPTNSTYTVSSSSLAVLQEEASKALALIEVGSWEEALEAAHLPESPHFLVVEAKSTAAEEQVKLMTSDHNALVDCF